MPQKETKTETDNTKTITLERDGKYFSATFPENVSSATVIGAFNAVYSSVKTLDKPLVVDSIVFNTVNDFSPT